MDVEKVQEYVERSESIIEQSPQMDEENTKVKLVQPFVKLLGWDIYSPAIELEYPIQMGVGTKKVDYALEIEDDPLVLVEAKGLDTPITDSHVSQLKSYMRQELSVEWGVLTNGQNFYIFKKGGDGGADGEVKIGDFDLEDFASNPDILEILSKESIASGHSADVIRQLNEAQQAIEELTERKEPIADKLSIVLTDEIGDVQSLEIQTETKEFVDKLIRTLEAQASLTSIGEQKTDGPTKGDDPEGWTPTQGANAVAGKIARSKLTGQDNAVVAVFPSKESGLRFLKENNAWAFVRIGQVPDYTAIYVTRTAREIQYVAEVKDVVEPHEADLARPVEEYTTGDDELDPNKRVVRFKPGTLYELEHPIPFGEEYPQGLRYTDLGRLKSATVTDDLF